MWRKFSIMALAVLLVTPFAGPKLASALTVSPVVIEYDIEAGDALVGSIKLHNEGTTTETFYPFVRDFIAGDASGSPFFVEAADERSLTDWISFETSAITLEPNETTYVVYNVSVPSTALPGGYFGGLLFATSPPDATDGVAAVGATGPLLLVRVEGELREIGSIKEFSVDRNSVSSLPVEFTVRFQNDGNVHVKPAGVIRVTNMFGGTAAVIPVNEAGGNVLPNSAREFSSLWQNVELDPQSSELVKEWKNFGFGSYTATLIMNFGETNQVETATTSFWIIPWMLIVLVFILLIIVALGIMQYNKWVVARAMQTRK